MISDKKCKLMLFVDYLLTVLFGMLGLFLFSWILRYSWGYIVYSALFTLIFFGMCYSRCWNKAKSDLKYQKESVRVGKAFRLTAPLAVTLLILIALFALIQYNIIPVRDIVTDVRYVFEENQPRQAIEVVVFDSIVPVMRLLFSFLIGFQPAEKTLAAVYLIAPAVAVLGGVSGYAAGMKKFYLSESILKAQQKIKEKFNE